MERQYLVALTLHDALCVAVMLERRIGSIFSFDDDFFQVGVLRVPPLQPAPAPDSARSAERAPSRPQTLARTRQALSRSNTSVVLGEPRLRSGSRPRGRVRFPAPPPHCRLGEHPEAVRLTLS